MSPIVMPQTHLDFGSRLIGDREVTGPGCVVLAQTYDSRQTYQDGRSSEQRNDFPSEAFAFQRSLGTAQTRARCDPFHPASTRPSSFRRAAANLPIWRDESPGT